MKKLLVIGLISSGLILGGCFKQEVVPEVQKVVQESVQSWMVQTGSIETSTGAAMSDNTKLMIDIFASKHWGWLKQGKKGNFDVYTMNPSGKEGNSYVVTFIVKNDKLIYTNLKDPNVYEWKESLSENIGDGFYGEEDQTYSSGVVFGVTWVGYWVSQNFIYINLQTLKKIYKDCFEWKMVIKEYYDKPKSDNTRKKLNLKATNIEDAYFEYYKEIGPIETNSWVIEQVSTGTVSGSWAESESWMLETVIHNESKPITNGLIKSWEKDKEIFYSWSVVVTWEYYFDNYFGKICFNNIDKLSSRLIPREWNDKRVPTFCFSNQEKAKKVFGISDYIINNMVSQDAEVTCTFKWKAEIQISDYIENIAETAVRDMTEIVKIIEKEPPEKKCL